MQELQLLRSEFTGKRICAYCSAKYKVKDFRTRKDKDERALSGMCQPCIDAAFGRSSWH